MDRNGQEKETTTLECDWRTNKTEHAKNMLAADGLWFVVWRSRNCQIV